MKNYINMVIYWSVAVLLSHLTPLPGKETVRDSAVLVFMLLAQIEVLKMLFNFIRWELTK